MQASFQHGYHLFRLKYYLSELYNNYAEAVKNKLEKSNIRVSLDCRAEKIGYKVRDARSERLPYIIVIGEKEQNSENISLRSRKNGDEGNCSLEAFISRITQEIDGKILDN